MRTELVLILFSSGVFLYHPTSRVLAVLELLQAQPGLISGAELADRLETDVRTIRRYVLKLQDVGIPIESVPGRAGGYRLRPGHRLPPLLFTPEEGMAAFLALMGSSWLEVGQDSAAVEGALSKVARVLPQESRQRIQALASSVAVNSPAGSRPLPGAGVLFDLSEAIQRNVCVEITYQPAGKEPTVRVVEPSGLVGRGGLWYLVAWCRLRSDFRIFRLDRAGAFRILETPFVPRKGFDYRAYARGQLDDYHRRFALTVWFHASPEEVAEAFPVGSGTAAAEAGGCLWTSRATDLAWAAQELLLTGWSFEVREPPELRDECRNVARRAWAASGRPLPPET